MCSMIAIISKYTNKQLPKECELMLDHKIRVAIAYSSPNEYILTDYGYNYSYDIRKHILHLAYYNGGVCSYKWGHRPKQSTDVFIPEHFQKYIPKINNEKGIIKYSYQFEPKDRGYEDTHLGEFYQYDLFMVNNESYIIFLPNNQ